MQAVAPRLAPFTVAVIGSGSEEHEPMAGAVGRLLAEMGVNLLTGGGQGVMRAVSRAYVEHPRETGICIGVIPSLSAEEPAKPKTGYPNELVELAIYTHLPHSGIQGTEPGSRNHINILSSAAVIALPGGEGTESELALALRYGKPAIAIAEDPERLRRFPAAIPRAKTIGEVSRFVSSTLGMGL
jgi:uncharacterized protein (TIGR00725 family)